MENTHLLIEPD